MAAVTTTGTVAVALSGTTSVTPSGVSGTPIAVIFWVNGKKTDGVTSTNLLQCVGFATASEQASMSIYSTDGVNPSVCKKGQRTDAAVHFVNNAESLIMKGAVTLKSGGFDIAWSNISGTDGSDVYYMILSGSDFTAADIVLLTSPALLGGAGIYEYTTGFQPDGLIQICGGFSASGNTTNGANFSLGMGFSDGRNSRHYFCFSQNGQATSLGRFSYTDNFIGHAVATSAINNHANVHSFTATGFKLNWLDATNQLYSYALAIKGGSWHVATYQTSSSVTTQTITGKVNTLRGVIHGNCVQASAGNFEGSPRWIMGFSNGTNDYCAGFQDVDGSSPTDSYLWQRSAKAMETYNTTTLLSTCTCTFSGNTFTLDWTTVLSGNYNALAVMIGDSYPTATSGLYVETGSVTIGAAIGEYRVDLSRFSGNTPKLVIGTSVKGGAVDGAITDHSGFISAAAHTGTTTAFTIDHVGLGWYGDTGSDPTICYQELSNNAFIPWITSSRQYSAVLSNMFPNGFTYKVSAVGSLGSTGALLHYMAIGGDDQNLQLAFVDLSTPTTNGDVSYTGVGFKPDLLIAFNAVSTSAINTVNINLQGMVGYTCGVGKEWCVANRTNHNGATVNADKVMDDFFIIGYLQDTLEQDKAVLKSFDTDGFTLTWSDTNASQRTVRVLCVKGISAHHQKVTAPATSQTTSGSAPFSIKGAIALSNAGSENVNSVIDCGFMFGASDGTDEFSIGWTEDDGATSDFTYGNQHRSCFLHTRNAQSGPGTLYKTGKVTDDTTSSNGVFAGANWTIDWTESSGSTTPDFGILFIGQGGSQQRNKGVIWAGSNF